VKTEIVGVFDNVNDGEKFAIKFSKNNNIVESKEWANLTEENCRNNIVINEEIKLKISKANAGRKHSEQSKRNMGNSHIGMKHSEQSKEKISRGHKGRPNGRLGKHLSEETKRKIGNAHTKSYLIIDTHGNERIITNLSKFCQENNLHDTLMGKVALGERKHHKGWICKKAEEIV
jgi:hypothetical protein